MTAAPAPVCPLGWRCEACGAEGERPAAGGGERLAVVEVATAAGLVCVTLCASCTVGVRSSGLPITVETAGRLAAQHREHLGVAGIFVCPVCGSRSHHPTDLAQGYCGACHDYTAPRRLVSS